MKLTQKKIIDLLKICFKECSPSMQAGIMSRSNGTLSERILPALLLLKAELHETREIELEFSLLDDEQALFNHKIRKPFTNHYGELLRYAESVAEILGKRYKSCSFEEFVADVHNIMSHLEATCGFDPSTFKNEIKSSRYPYPKAKKKLLDSLKARMLESKEPESFLDYDHLAFEEILDESFVVITEIELREKGDANIKEFLNNCAYLLEAISRMGGVKPELDKQTIDETIMLAALAGCNGFSRICADKFGLPDFRIRFPKKSTKLRSLAMEKVDRRTVAAKRGTSRSSSSDFFSIAKDEHLPKLEFAEAVSVILGAITTLTNNEMKFDLDSDVFNIFTLSLKSKCVEPSNDYAIFSEFLELNKITDQKETFALVKAASVFLRKNVIGQPLAVESIADQLSGLIINGGKQHLGVSTFFGVSGTGKTHSAESIGRVFADLLDANFQIETFNMEQFQDGRDVSRLFGSGSQYVDSALGALTLPVIKNPRCIFIFDEIEKAHPLVVQSLLTPIDKGYAIDSTSEMRVDMSQCYFIFTTNLGSKSIESWTGAGMLDPRDLLTQKDSENHQSFSLEMLNRLASGNIAIFQALNERDIVRLATTAAQRIEPASITPPDNLSEIILATLGSDVSPRAISSQWQKIEGRILRELIDTVPEDEMHKLHNIRFSTQHVYKHTGQDINVKVLSAGPFTDYLDVSFKVSTDTSLDSIRKALASDADAILIDEDTLKADMAGLIMLLKEFNTKPVFSCSNLGIQSKLASFAELSLLDRHYKLESQTTQDIGYVVNQIKRQLITIRKTGEALSRNMCAEYAFSYDIREDSVEVRIASLTHRQKVKKEDAELSFLTFAEKPDCSLKDVIGMDREKEQFKVIINGLQAGNDNDIPLPAGYLLTGRPGTGKTHLARCIAGESNLFCFGVDAANLLSGNAVENINRLFEAARRYSPSIIFIDEFDAIGKCRKASGFLNTAAVNALLTAMHGFEQRNNKVFVLAATNHPQVIDEALLRPGRFDRVIHFEAPCQKGRRQCISQWFKDRGKALTTNLETELALSTLGGTVAEIRHIFDNSVLSALAQNTIWQPSMLKEAIRSARFGNIKEQTNLSSQQRKITAYHEAGHLVAHRLLLPEVPVEMVSIQPRGAALGMVVPGQANSEPCTTRRHVKNYLQVFLAGIVSEHMLGLCGDEQTTGAVNDREMATRLTKQAIVQWGMSDCFGLAIPLELNITSSDVNAEVIAWLAEAKHNVEALLDANRHLLDKIADALIEKEVLEKLDIDELFAQSHNFLSSVDAA
jgi:cell division protease FtsH